MIKFETEFECSTEQEVIDTLEHIIDRIQSGYACGYLTDTDAEGDWGMDGEEEEEREVYVEWDVSDSEFETFMNEGIPRKVYVPMSVAEEDIADWLSDKYGYCVESYTIDNE